MREFGRRMQLYPPLHTITRQSKVATEVPGISSFSSTAQKKDALTLCSLRLYFLSAKQTCGLAGILEKEFSSWDSHSFVSSPWISSQTFSTEQVTWTTFSLWVADKFAHAILSAHRDKILFVSWFHNTEFWYANVPSLQYPTINTR